MVQSKNQALEIYLKELKMSSILEFYGPQALHAEDNSWPYPRYLLSLVEKECSRRRERKVGRNRSVSKLPTTKTSANLKLSLFSPKIRKIYSELIQGQFISRCENILAFGLPGVGKSHFLAAIGHELVTAGYRVYFSPAYTLVEALLIAKKELSFEKLLKRLDGVV